MLGAPKVEATRRSMVAKGEAGGLDNSACGVDKEAEAEGLVVRQQRPGKMSTKTRQKMRTTSCAGLGQE